jgi:pyrimidine-nucleoside phosphorylase
MRAVDIIAAKRDGAGLSAEQIDFFVQGFATGDIPDYQVSAWAMAVLLRGMTDQETIDLTMAMVRSGETLDMSSIAPIVVDKHSTGGVGDKTTLVVAPLVAAAGLPVAKMSGRGLGFSGGTLDKLESIPGFTVSLTMDRFLRIARKHGIVVAGQTADLAPADGKLYALRDVTATVPSLPLIASSIMSKKIAAGGHALVLDVKVGRGAFMTTEEEARRLAEIMIRIGEGVGRQVTAVLSDMNQPLGNAVGNAIEVAEAIDALEGRGPADLREHCLIVAAEMLVLGRIAATPDDARAQLQSLLDGGEALTKFEEWVAAQGGNPGVTHDRTLLPQAPVQRPVPAPQEGAVEAIDAREVGLASVALGAGRQKKGEPVDPAVGIILNAKVGDRISRGESLSTVHARDEAAAEEAASRIRAAYRLTEAAVTPPPLFYGILRGQRDGN